MTQISDEKIDQLECCLQAATGVAAKTNPDGDVIGWSPAYQRTVELRAELVETRALAAFYRSCALSGEDPGEADEALAKVRAVLREAADKRQPSSGMLP